MALVEMDFVADIGEKIDNYYISGRGEELLVVHNSAEIEFHESAYYGYATTHSYDNDYFTLVNTASYDWTITLKKNCQYAYDQGTDGGSNYHYYDFVAKSTGDTISLTPRTCSYYFKF